MQPGRTTFPQYLSLLGETWEDMSGLAQIVPMATNFMVPTSFQWPAGTNPSGFYRLESRLP